MNVLIVSSSFHAFFVNNCKSKIFERRYCPSIILVWNFQVDSLGHLTGHREHQLMNVNIVFLSIPTSNQHSISSKFLEKTIFPITRSSKTKSSKTKIPFSQKFQKKYKKVLEHFCFWNLIKNQKKKLMLFHRNNFLLNGS